MQAWLRWTPSPGDFRAAQLVTMLSIALVMGCGFVPAARPYQWRLSVAVIVIDVVVLAMIAGRHMVSG